MDNKALLSEAIEIIGLNKLAHSIKNLSGEPMSRQNLSKYANGERAVQPWLLDEVRNVLFGHKRQLNSTLEMITKKTIKNYRDAISQPIVPVFNQNGGITYANLLHPDTLSDCTWCERKERWQSLLHGNFSNQCEHSAVAPSVDFAQALIACGHPAEELVKIYRSQVSGEDWRERVELIHRVWETIIANDLPKPPAIETDYDASEDF